MPYLDDQLEQQSPKFRRAFRVTVSVAMKLEIKSTPPPDTSLGLSDAMGSFEGSTSSAPVTPSHHSRSVGLSHVSWTLPIDPCLAFYSCWWGRFQGISQSNEPNNRFQFDRILAGIKNRWFQTHSNVQSVPFHHGQHTYLASHGQVWDSCEGK